MQLHDLHHFSRNIKLWQMNQKMARQIVRHVEPVQYGDYTITMGSLKHLKDIERAHAELFREPMLGWLVWLYRFRANDLVTVALNQQGELVGYECFMFNESEIKDLILHEVYIGVHEQYQGKGIATAMRKFSISSYEFGNLSGLSTVAVDNDIKALRSAQKSGFSIQKHSLKPPGYYMYKALFARR